jgi:hypothetical protein
MRVLHKRGLLSSNKQSDLTENKFSCSKIATSRGPSGAEVFYYFEINKIILKTDTLICEGKKQKALK